MLQVESSPTLADLSRNASVISSSSDSESIQDVPRTPRPRPTRTFSSPRSRSPQLPAIQPIRPPSYLTRELGVSDRDSAPYPARSRPHPRSQSRKRSRSRNPSANNRLSSQDFTFLSTLGEGSYSSVMRARHIRTGQDYAIKILDKNHLARKDKMAVAMTEKLVLIKLGAGHPGIIHLHWTFQDDWSLFFVLDLAPNGEMQTRISRMGSLSLACARHYTAQIIDALDYMHAKDVIHRDLKPENLLLDGDYRIKITDFGTGKILEPGQERANSWVGTAQYISPELLEHGETSKRSDLWSLGCVVYQMIAGRFAFHGPSEYLTWQKIKKLDYTFPEGFDEDAKDFVQRLFVLDPTQRLGAGPEGSPNSRAALRAHPFLASTKWETLWTDPSPPLEAGLVQKEGWKNALGNAGTINGLDEDEDEWEGKWGDVGAIWDSLVGGEDNDGEVRGSGWNGGGGGSRINGTDASTRLDTGRGGSRYIEEGARA
ncbi:kinase-like domain-containing protein [Scleroderma citrinum]